MKIFHHNDNDGRLSAFLVSTSFDKGELKNSNFVEVNYGKPFPVEVIEKGEIIWIVDFNPAPDEMLEILCQTYYVTWVDHHKTTLEAYKNFPHEIEGIRDTSKAACELVWEYLYPGEAAPAFVKLVGDRDTWTFKYGDDSRNFHLGSGLHDPAPLSSFWARLWNAELNEGQVIASGKIVKTYRDRQNADLRKAWAYETEFEGHKCLAIVSGLKSSELFGDEIKNYGICIAAAHNGDRWVVSLYSETVDVGEIAKRHGGGGHRGAAGFPCEELPFSKLQKKEEITND